MGLDRNDPIIRRRLQQKLEFLTQDVVAQAEPSESDLNALLQSQPEKFRIGQSFSFSHVYLSAARGEDNARETAAALLVQLNSQSATADISALGDHFLLGNAFDSIPADEAAKLFGGDFAARLAALSTGTWQGPVKSGYGLHLMYLRARSEGRRSDLDEARDASGANGRKCIATRPMKRSIKNYSAATR